MKQTIGNAKNHTRRSFDIEKQFIGLQSVMDEDRPDETAPKTIGRAIRVFLTDMISLC